MEVISTRRYEVRPPADSHASILVDPMNAVATVKEEEWETRKKKEITTTRQIETRVKRQVVLEDGEVVVDSGPLVTTNTTEDVEQQEHTTQERRTTGDEPQKVVEWPTAVKTGAVVQKELNETIVKSREEIEELLETEDRQHLGDITDEAYLQAVRNNRGDLRLALAESTRQLAGHQSPGPRVLQHTTRSNKVVDTERTLERSELKHDGQIVTERKTTVEHEEIKDDELPPEELKGSSREELDEVRETRKEATQRYTKTRDEDIVDYLCNGERVAREMRYVSETTEAERTGDWPSDPPPGLRSSRLHHKHDSSAAASRKDLEEEDEARKFETSKWLESHFGSESRSSHGGSLDEEPLAPHPGGTTSYINVTMKSSCAPQQRHNLTSRETNSPSGYFRGISEWSERYQSTDNHKLSTQSLAKSPPPQYILETSRETSRMNGHHQPEISRNQETSYTRTFDVSRRHQERHSPLRERPKTDPPSPPLRRKAREQGTTTTTQATQATQATSTSSTTRSERTRSRGGGERIYHHQRERSQERGGPSPVHVVQRTWESRSRDAQEERRGRSSRGPDSRSITPSPARTEHQQHSKKDDHHHSSRPSKSPSPSKYKIGESFRKLMGRLRSASSERKNKHRQGSTSQLTQTEDGSTYLQYNSVDRNVPLGTDYDTSEERPPERPARSPRGSQTPPRPSESKSSQTRYRSPKPPSPKLITTAPEQVHQIPKSDQPIHRYYLGEDPFGGSIYGREKGYRDSKPHSSRHRSRTVDEEHSAESSSLGRFSRSTSRLANGYDRGNHERTSAQTLPRKMHISNHSRQQQQQHHQQQHHHREHHSSSSSSTRRLTNGHSSSPVTRFSSSSSSHSSPRQYGSMINVSFRNQVMPKTTTHYVQTSFNPREQQQPPHPPLKPERTYKSTLSRSKSFNVEIADDGVVSTPRSNGYLNNIRSNSHLNRLDETPPLKSPGILASISRSNRDLMRNGGGRHDY